MAATTIGRVCVRVRMKMGMGQVSMEIEQRVSTTVYKYHTKHAMYRVPPIKV